MNIILTGEKHIGKSTLASKVLHRMNRPYAGFITGFDGNRVLPDRRLFMYAPGSSAREAVVVWRDGIPLVDTARFNTVGTALLDAESSLYVMDELGKFETDALAFRDAVCRRFDGDCDVLAVVRYDALGWMQSLKSRSDVMLITVTLENRDTLPETVCAALCGEK